MVQLLSGLRRDTRRNRKQFPQLDRALLEGVLNVGVHVQRPDPSAPRSGIDSTLCTPKRPARGPNRGHALSPPSDPEVTVRPSAAAVMQGP